MLIDTSITIAYKCCFCGTYEFINISLFRWPGKGKELHLKCRCNKYGAAISRDSSGKYAVRVGCIACGKEHIFMMSRKEVLHKSINVFHCPETGMQQCFVGDDNEVRKKIDSIEKELDELIDMFGYESYFKNTRVVFDSLNKIHDIAEEGNLHCGCGSKDIELTLLSEKILLKCRKCNRSTAVKTASNEDLKHLMSSKQILLGCETDEGGRCSKELFSIKTDGKYN